MTDIARRIAIRLVWLACAVLFALGSSGIVAGAVHQPGTDARAELTWVADEALRPELAAAVVDLQKLATDVDALGNMGRLALVALVDRQIASLSAAIADGGDLVDRIDAETAALRQKVADLPGLGPGAEARLGADLLAEADAVTVALDTTAGLGAAWAQLTSGSTSAITLTTLLADQDRYAAAAALAGSRGEYAAALDQAKTASSAISQAKGLRDQLANTVDVTVLTAWIDRNAALDKGLVQLYTAMEASQGRVTTDVRTALAAVNAAKDRLPPDTRGLVVIMSDVARGGLNQAVIAIEEAKGRLNDAVDALQGPPAVGASVPPGVEASPSVETNPSSGHTASPATS